VGKFFRTEAVQVDALGQSLTVYEVDTNLSKVDDLSIPLAQGGVLTVRTNNTDGTLTMNNVAHGIVTGQRFDLFWAPAGKPQSRFYCVAGTVSGTSVPFTGGTGGGANLPAATTPMTVGVSTSRPFVLTGSNLSALFMALPQGWNGYFAFDSAGTIEEFAQYVRGGYPYSWWSADQNGNAKFDQAGNPIANPLAGDLPQKVWISHDNQTFALGAAPTPSALIAALAH
jgi:hypothetical protein